VAVSVAIVGTRDAQIEELVRASGLQATASWLADLSTLTPAGSRQPDVVLIDLRGQTQVPSSLPLLRKQHPGTGVIILASALDPGLMLQAMRAGVTECIAEPLRQDEFTAALTRVAGQRAAAAPAAVFAFVGAKGGVGTTTTAVNVATSLASLAPTATLLIDLHLAYGDAAVFLGAEPRYSMLDAVENLHRFDTTFFKGLVVRTGSGLDLLASSTRASVAPVAGRALTSVIEFAASQYGHIVLDVPRSDNTALDSLDQVNTIVVVANQELATVRNAGRMAAALRTRYPKARVTTVINRTDRRAELEQRDIEKAVGGAIAHQFPSDYRRAVHAMNTGRPLTLDNHNELSASFTSLARDLAGLKKDKPAKKSSGFMGLLSGRS
jgi:pilus assembly protein CpaE